MAEERRGIAQALARSTAGFVDCDGVVHAAPALTLADLADLEKCFGPMADWGEAMRDQNAAISFLWHSLRKEGLTKDSIRKREWSVTEQDVGEMFVIGDVTKIMDVLFSILAISGLETAQPVVGARPPPAAQTGEASSVPPSPAASPAQT